MSSETEGRTARIAVPSVDSSLGRKLLPTALSLTAGSVDIISFLGLGGLFAADITGNLVIMAARLVTGGPAPLAEIVPVPVFIGVLGLTRGVAAALEALRIPTLRPLMIFQLVLLGASQRRKRSVQRAGHCTVNPIFTWVRLAQRIPVGIQIEDAGRRPASGRYDGDGTDRAATVASS